jgi:DNA-binding Lrp family transcriptional regulator
VDPRQEAAADRVASKDVRPPNGVDDLDRRILDVLRDDARMSNAELAAAVGVAPSTAHVRLRSLRERGILTGFVTSVDHRRLGRGLQALIHVGLRPGARQASITDFAGEIRRLPQVLQVFFLGGVDDFIVHVAVADSSALREFVVDHLSSKPTVASTRTSIVFDYYRNGVAASFD